MRRYDILTVTGILALALGIPRACNVACNTQTRDGEDYHTESVPTGLYGHVEYTRHADGSQDVKVYPDLGHRMFDSQLDQDLNGDGLVDRIRRNGGEWKMNRLDLLLVREHDYETYMTDFAEADNRMQACMNRGEGAQ